MDITMDIIFVHTRIDDSFLRCVVIEIMLSCKQNLFIENVELHIVSFFRFRYGKFYIITGSKNVHMIIKEKEDIDKYIGDRFAVAKVRTSFKKKCAKNLYISSYLFQFSQMKRFSVIYIQQFPDRLWLDVCGILFMHLKRNI